MRTSIDLPDDLYRNLKIRAAESGETLRDLMVQFAEAGLKAGLRQFEQRRGRRDAPPVLISPRGVPIPALSPEEIRRIVEDEDIARYA